MSITTANLRLYVQAHGWKDVSTQGLVDELTFINETLQGLAGMRNWPHLEKQGVTNLTAPYSTGTVAVANGATAVTLTTGTFAAAMANQTIIFNTDPTREYQIASIGTGGGGCVLASAYLGTALTVGTYTVYYSRYTAPTDFGRASRFLCYDAGGEIAVGDFDQWIEERTSQPKTTSTVPTMICPAREATANYFYVSPFPTQAAQVRYLYWRQITALSGAGDPADWPDRLLPLFQTALRKRLALDDRSAGGFVLLRDQMKADLDAAYNGERPTVLPVRTGLSHTGRQTVEQRQSRVRIL